MMAVSLSTNAIKLYGPATGQYLGDCLGHTNTISDIAFPDSSSPNILCSSSADGTVRAWDIRLRKEVSGLYPAHTLIIHCFVYLCILSFEEKAQLLDMSTQVVTLRTENQELWSFDIGGSTQNLVASGGNAAVTLTIFLYPRAFVTLWIKFIKICLGVPAPSVTIALNS